MTSMIPSGSRRLRPTIAGWFRTVGPQFARLARTCEGGDVARVVAAARETMRLVGEVEIPAGEERTVAEWYGIAALVADTWRAGDPDVCRDVFAMVGRATAELYELR